MFRHYLLGKAYPKLKVLSSFYPHGIPNMKKERRYKKDRLFWRMLVTKQFWWWLTCMDTHTHTPLRIFFFFLQFPFYRTLTIQKHCMYKRFAYITYKNKLTFTEDQDSLHFDYRPEIVVLIICLLWVNACMQNMHEPGRPWCLVNWNREDFQWCV